MSPRVSYLEKWKFCSTAIECSLCNAHLLVELSTELRATSKKIYLNNYSLNHLFTH